MFLFLLDTHVNVHGIKLFIFLLNHDVCVCIGVNCHFGECDIHHSLVMSPRILPFYYALGNYLEVKTVKVAYLQL